MTRQADLLVLGASGRVGTLLRGVLDRSARLRAGVAPAGPAAAGPADTEAPHILWQYRSGPAGGGVLKWQPGRSLPRGLRARAVLALWGVTRGTPGALDQNAVLARAALHLARRVGAGRVLHLSSGAVQAGLAGSPLEERMPLAPLTPYGAAKAQMERAIAEWHERQGPGAPRSVILRVGNVTGADALSVALEGAGPITLDRFADGTGPRRSCIGPEDLARVLGRLVTCPDAVLPDILNLAGPAPVSMADLVRAAGRPLLWRPAPAGALPVLPLDTTRLATLGLDLSESASAPALLAQWRRARNAAARAA